uniref:Replication timing regulatory factor 1 n=1 Tax=Varanus komodoensis TaxID=61221 RepID=A0A8D2LRJ2_VARKO
MSLDTTYIPTENSELSSAALQALGFCVFHSKIASLLSEVEIQELLSIVSSVAVKMVDKNTRTRALWVISKQSFPPDIVGKLVPSIIAMLETVLKGELHSMVVEYEALNVIIRLIEQAPSHMEEEAVRWAKLIIPLVVHSAHKVQLRGATALEMGMPLLLQKQQEVAAVTEELMTTKIIPELQKLFSSKNETYVLKLWPLFIKLLGKALHRSGSFINSLLQLEELGFRSGSPVVKKIAFIAWKSLIDNFALNPEILCSAKRLKLLMQPLSSIHVRTEALALTKLEVWWYLLMRLGPQLPVHFEQVCVPLIQSTLSLDASLLQGNSSRLSINQSVFPFGTSPSPRVKLNSSTSGVVPIPSIRLLGIEMLLHFFMGPEVLTFAKENSVVFSLEPLQYPVIASPSFFCKHANTFINAVQDGFIAIGKDASVMMLILKSFILLHLLVGSKRERQNSELLTALLQALKNIVMSNELPVLKSLSLIEITIKELPPKVLGSPAYQIADMDLLNGTPALFLIQLSFRKELLECCVQDERFFLNYESLVRSVLSGPTSPLAFSESVFTVVNHSAQYLENKEHLWRIWSIVVNPLTDWINQTNEVNQGDALEHNFSPIYSALLLPVNHIFPSSEFPRPTMKTLLRSWSELYRAFARCALLVATAEDNLCCEELCAKILPELEDETHMVRIHYLKFMVDCINFAPYGNKLQPANTSPQIPTDWSKKKKDPLGKLSSLIKLLMIMVNSLQTLASKESGSEKLAAVGTSVVGVLQNIIGHISLPSVIRSLFGTITKPVAEFIFNWKIDKSISCWQSHYTGSFDGALLQELSPLLCVMLSHKNKQMRNQAVQFWNASFGKATENSQLDAKISGIEVNLCAKRDSLLAKTSDLKEKSINSHVTPAKMKVEFPLPKPNRKNMLLEEENTLDFVFIPQETKERVLTEHQKEVLRTKRVDIPTMYNDLDASQDTALFSQHSQSQEDSFSLSRCERKLKQEESEMCAPKSVPEEPSVLNSSLNGNTSNVSNSSASSDVISGTPPPVSRRQSFITLEKFDSSGNRPFSPSTFSNTSGSIPSVVNQDTALGTYVKSESLIGIKRSSLRQNKTEFSEDKKAKLMKPDQEKNIQASPAKHTEDKHELLVETQEAEYLLDKPSQTSSLNVIGSMIESKCVLESVAEMKPGPNLDTKENTPPEVAVPGDAMSNVSQAPQSSPSQKTLRRSLRRKPEATEGAAASQDKENSQQKKDDEKVLPKKNSQGKETVTLKPKPAPEKPVDADRSVHGSGAAEGITSKESHVSVNIQEETNTGTGRVEGSTASDIDELQDSGADAAIEKPKGFPRYHTRRASQGLLTSIENSESDSSETREEGTKRKRSGRWKNKSNSLESQVKEELASPELHSLNVIEIQATTIENKDVMHAQESMEIASDNNEKGDKNTPHSPECPGLKQSTDPPQSKDSSDMERNAKMLTQSASEAALESHQEAVILDTVSVPDVSTSSPIEVAGDDNLATAFSAFPSSEKSSELSECQHKRSKRTRRSKSCDCCGEKPLPLLEKSSAELKKTGSPETRLKEQKRTPNKAAVALLPIPAAEESHSAERLTVEPCAASTPLPSTNDFADLKDSSRLVQPAEDLPGNAAPEDKLQECACIESESKGPVAETMDCTEFAEAPSELTASSHSKEPFDQCEPLDAATDLATIEKSDVNQYGQLGDETDEETGINQPEETKANETTASENNSIIEHGTEETAADFVPVVSKPQENLQEEDAEEDAENDIADASVESQASALVQKEGDSDSPLKLEELDALSLAKISGSPNGVQARCIWSPSASPSTSILKRGFKRQQEEESTSPANKSRRVSFANPIYQEEMADDIDRRSPVVRAHLANGSQSFRSPKLSPNHQAKITEMVKEPLPAPTESIYPPLMGCKAPVDTILPQITSNIWARGLGQLIRAKNIRTVGDLSSLSATEIKTLPIRSPKVSNVRKALKGYHEQQIKTRGFEETAGLDDTEKPVSGIDEKPFSTNEDKLITDAQTTTNLCTQISILAAQITSESLVSYSGSELFEMQEKLHSMTNCIMKSLQARWKSPSRESTV